MRLVVSTLVMFGCALGFGWRSHAQESRDLVRIAVVNTPDVLLSDLLPVFLQETGYRTAMQVTENAYDVARNGMADLVIAHYGHPGTEAFVTEGLGQWPRMVFANQAVLVGPSRDPVGIRDLDDAATAFSLLIRRGGEFLVNNAPTERYLAEVFWDAAGRPPRTGWYLDLGLRDQAAVEAAAQRGAYTLWGLVPFVRLQAQRPLGLEALVNSDPLLQRIMVSVVVNPDRVRGVNLTGALALQRFLLQPSTQARIRQFRHDELRFQTWWPGARNNAPADLMPFLTGR